MHMCPRGAGRRTLLTCVWIQHGVSRCACARWSVPARREMQCTCFSEMPGVGGALGVKPRKVAPVHRVRIVHMGNMPVKAYTSHNAKRRTKVSFLKITIPLWSCVSLFACVNTTSCVVLLRAESVKFTANELAVAYEHSLRAGGDDGVLAILRSWRALSAWIPVARWCCHLCTRLCTWSCADAVRVARTQLLF